MEPVMTLDKLASAPNGMVRRSLLGGKGYGLVVMSKLLLPVPAAAIVLNTPALRAVKENGYLHQYLMSSIVEVLPAVAGESEYVSVRSSGVVSMPGMMDTVLNVPARVENVTSRVMEVLASYDSPRCKLYREKMGIEDKGTAVVIQRMVSGIGPDSGTGVVFTRNPLTGERELFGEYLLNAQGPDLVGGQMTPQPLQQLREGRLKGVYEQIETYAWKLEEHFGQPQDIEFTFNNGAVFLLQTRAMKPQWTRQKAQVGEAGNGHSILQGIPASAGMATGVVVTSVEEVVKRAEAGEKVVLFRQETSPDDLEGMLAAVAIVTVDGGATCHAAITARALDKPCVVGCQDANSFLRDGVRVTVDGTAGKVEIL